MTQEKKLKSGPLAQDDKIYINKNNDLKRQLEEIKTRKAFLDFTDEDVAHLKELHALISNDTENIVKIFYNHILSFVETKSLITNDAMLDNLEKSLAAYFSTLTEGNYDLEYVSRRRRIGTTHHRIGLNSQWYIGAYSKYLTLLISKLSTVPNESSEHIKDMLTAITKIIFFDISVSVDTYIEAREAKIQRMSVQLSELNNIAVNLTNSMDVDNLLMEVMKGSVNLTGAYSSCITLYSPEKKSFHKYATYGLPDKFVEKMVFRVGGLAESIFNDGRYIISSDRENCTHKLSKLTRDEGIKCFICLPLTSRTKQLGLLYLYRTDLDHFMIEEIETLITFSHLASGAIDNAQLHEDTLNLATTDGLTNLLNRRSGEEKLEHERARVLHCGSTTSLLMIDVDFFKKVNDKHGHLAGDCVLVELANIFTAQLRNIDIASRFGGEEFIVILPETPIEGALIVANRIRNVVENTPIKILDGSELNVTVSIGITMLDKTCNIDKKILIGQADQALYDAKNSGRNAVRVYKNNDKPSTP